MTVTVSAALYPLEALEMARRHSTEPTGIGIRACTELGGTLHSFEILWTGQGSNGFTVEEFLNEALRASCEIYFTRLGVSIT